MINMDDFFMTAKDGTKVHCVFSKPDGEIKGLVHIVHGMAEYAARYKPLMEFFSANGYLAFGHDHLGHGLTAADVSELGYIPLKGAESMINHTVETAEYFAAQYPDKPLYVMGHSMGSFIVRCVIAKSAGLYKAVALSGTGYSVPGAALGRAFVIYRSRTRGEKTYSDGAYKMVFGKYNKKTANRTAYDWTCRDDSVVDEYLADEYCGFPFTVSALAVMMDLNMGCNKSRTFAATPKNLPILLQSGTDDPVGDYGRGATNVYKAYKKNGIEHVELKLYPGARHEVVNELNKAEVMQDMLDWYERYR